MSHELTTNTLTNKIEYAYLRSDGAGWHGLGNPVDNGTNIDEWREAAGMNWCIKRSKVRYATAPDANFLELPEQHVLFRSDTKAALGIVSERYNIVQPAQVLEFFRDIVRVGGLELSAAGTIYGGKRFWATAKIGEASPLSVKDSIGGFLLVSTSADGSSGTEVRRTSVRTVCENTLAMAMADAKPSVRVTHRSVFDPAQVTEFMGLNEAAWAAFRHQIVRLANVTVNDELADITTAALLGTGPSDDKVRLSAGYNKIIDLFKGDGKGAKLDGVFGTGWGYVNAVTEYVDHWTRARSDENRFVSAQWGPGSDLKTRALNAMTALLPT
jgi:phage/plasmid-like protein (TIGR03299 family)